MNTKRLIDTLKGEDVLRHVLVEIKDSKESEVKWGEIKAQKEEEHALGYTLLGELEKNIRINLVLLFTSSENEKDWAGTYTLALHIEVLEPLTRGGSGLYQRVVHSHKDVVLVFTTEEIKSGGEEIEKVTEEQFLSLDFQRGMAHFLLHAFRPYIPLKGGKSFMEDSENFLSHTETLYYRLEKK